MNALSVAYWTTKDGERRVMVSDPPPVIPVAHKILTAIKAGETPLGAVAEVKGGLLRVKGTNRTVVYRLDHFNELTARWSAVLVKHEVHSG